MKQFIAIAALAALGGCITDEVDASKDLCGAAQLAYLVGQDAGVLGDLVLPENRRVLHPGMAYTADYQPDRLNISIDEDEVIERVWCS